jgi:hypothetical protein
MEDRTIEAETRMYLYDLSNSAKEHGFKADDSWEFSIATNIERMKIQKDYYPTIATKIIPEIMLQVYHGIKEKLNQSFGRDEEQLSKQSILSGELSFLVAYNPKRPRT